MAVFVRWFGPSTQLSVLFRHSLRASTLVIKYEAGHVGAR